MYINTHARTHARTHTHVQYVINASRARMLSRNHSRTHAFKPTCTNMRTCTNVHIHAHTRTQTHARNTHTHKYKHHIIRTRVCGVCIYACVACRHFHPRVHAHKYTYINILIGDIHT